jgi:hypothetical protein
MKLIGLVILGLVSGFGITYAATYLIAWLLSLFLKTNGTASSGGGGDAGIFIGLLVFFPIAFFIGGIVTGYFSYYEIENKLGLPALAPGLYCGMLFVCVAGLSSLSDCLIGGDPIWHFAGALGIGFSVGLYWWLVSAGGVFLGYYLRERFAKWWYRD